MKLTFYGGARGVTGACYLLETKKTNILVDCGLFQGSDKESFNSEPFRFDPKKVDALFVTHAHIDHIGRIPKLVKDGFQGTIYSTAPTKAISRVLLEDALNLALREEAAFYSSDDIEKAFTLWKELPYGKELPLEENVQCTLREAGHILGSAFIHILADNRNILFTGDFGNTPSILLPTHDSPNGVEYLVIESTYGNKVHESDTERRIQLERAVEDITSRRGTLVIPAFATERTQDLLYLFNEMITQKRIPDIPVYVDSPLAIKVTRIFEQYYSFYRDDIRSLYTTHPDLFKFKKLHLTETVEESKNINNVPPPKVVIAGSGMITGGRILHHLRRYLGDSKSILLIVGYQSAGSLGRRLLEGEKYVRIFGEEIEVAAEIRHINGFSAHADNPQLFSFVEGLRGTLKKVFVVQGEDAPALHLTQDIRDRLGLEAQAPLLYDSVELP